MQVIYDPAKFFELVWDERNAIGQIRPIGENAVAVSYQRQDDYIDVLPNTNVVMAAFTTAQARLKLYSYIEKLQERVLYFDTGKNNFKNFFKLKKVCFHKAKKYLDSVIYLTRPGDTYEPPTGSFLGDLTNELEEYGPGAYIQEFVSGGKIIIIWFEKT